MSGDMQPKKRKDKRRKKDDVPGPEDPVIQPTSTVTTAPDDFNIHVHSDHETGGGLCAKFIFFVLLSVLAVLIGIIITQNRGLTDLDTPVSESRFAKIFDGWLDESTADHEDHAPVDFGDEHAEHEVSDEDHHASEEEHEEEHEEQEHADEDDEKHVSDEDQQVSEEQEEGDDEDEQASEEQQVSEEDQQGSEEEQEANEDEQQESEEDQLSEDDPEEGNEEPLEGDQEDEQVDDQNDDQDDEKTEDAENVTNEDDNEDNNDDDDDEQVDSASEEGDQDQIDSGENDLQRDTEEDGKSDENDDQTENEEDNQTQSEENDDIDDEETAGSQEISKENEVIEEDSTEIQTGAIDDDEQEEVIDNTAGEEELLKQEAEKQTETEEESSNVAVKFGVGVALVVVAHIVLVRKWRSGQSKDKKNAQEEETVSAVPRRNTIVPPPPLEQVEHDIQNVEEEYSEEEAEEESEEEINIEPVSSKSEYLELRSTYRSLTPEEDIREKIAGLIGRQTDDQPIFYDNPNDEYEEEEGEEEYDDEEGEHADGDQEDDVEIEYGDRDEEEEIGTGDIEEDVEEEEEISDVDDEELLKKLEARYGKLPTSRDIKADEDVKVDSWKKVKTAASDKTEERSDEATDWTKPLPDNLKEKLKLAEAHLRDNAEVALAIFNDLVKKVPDNIRIKYGHAKALDKLAEVKRSNELLQDAISSYYDLLQHSEISDKIYKQVGERCLDRMRFKGQYSGAIHVHRQMINRFPNEPQYQNQLAVTFLTINRLSEAKRVLQDVLMQWPNDGFAQVHYGFVLKTLDNDIVAAVKYLRSGIASRAPGVIDGRFYFHLGDALTRLGRTSEATKVYEDGVKFKIFLSKYQRSLYNVDRLTGRPWWSLNQTPYAKFFKLLEDKWEVIRDEGLALLNKASYFKDEAENLRDVGEWKQYELYARGIKFRKNCQKCPETCKIIDNFPDARSCKRGQVKFSVMHPGTHVWPHCGPTNCRLRAHLGLKVPANTFIRVAEETRSWQEGKVFLFDDSFEHEVWHNGSDIRLVLILDVWHPELTAAEKISLPAI